MDSISCLILLAALYLTVPPDADEGMYIIANVKGPKAVDPYKAFSVRTKRKGIYGRMQFSPRLYNCTL